MAHIHSDLHHQITLKLDPKWQVQVLGGVSKGARAWLSSCIQTLHNVWRSHRNIYGRSGHQRLPLSISPDRHYFHVLSDLHVPECNIVLVPSK